MRVDLRRLAQGFRPRGMTEEQKEAVRDYYGRVPTKELAEQIGATVGQIRGYVAYAGIPFRRAMKEEK